MTSSTLTAPRRRGRLRIAAVLAVAVALIVAPAVQAANATNINIQLPAAFSIAGTIRDNAGAVLPNATIYASATNGSGFGETDATGKYKVLALNPGQYQIMVIAPETKNLVDGFYTTANANHFTASAAAATKVTVGGNKAGIDVKLPAGYTITGTITNTAATPTPLAGIAVGASGLSNDQTTTDAAGKYTLRGLAAGAYKLTLSPSGNTSYLSGFYSTANANRFVLAIGSASNITVGPSRSAINIKIPTGYTISGKIMNAAGAALPDVSVNAFKSSYSRQVTTDAAGNYQIKGLAAGTYKLELNPPSDGAQMDGFYTSANANRFTSQAAGATGIVVGPHKTGINIKIATGHSISGTITNTAGVPQAYAYVSADSSTGGYRDATTDAAGKYKIQGLATGSQTLSVYPPYGENLQTGFYTSANGNRFTPLPANATAIAVGPSKTGINIKLPAGYSISGKILKDVGDVPLDFALVFVTSTNFSGTAFTEADGTYQVVGLSAATYKVQAYPSSDLNLQTGYYKSGAAPNFTVSVAAASGVAVGP
jgi:protocatechuate 3,4-dioxygenase beta subunit